MDQDYTPEHRADTPAEEPVVGDAPPAANTLLSNRAYDKLKWVAQILLPALGAFYFGLAQLLGLPYGLEVVGVLALLDTFLGTILGISTKQYKNSDAAFDGAVVLTPDHENEVTDVGVSLNPSSLESGQKELRLRVRHQ